ncbi:secreted RxLR effector protein 161-like [Manihot esculenta]|uniref:secreted RxLR effector protein 161-like n=1 Tax=Manihot esculenta TaxID=3983 RepID=UPI001CC3EBB8|nr:secreted RxLR effector protein 161-like [Manihot esculenta]
MQNSEGIYLSQKKYASELLERFHLHNGNPVKNPIVPGSKFSKDGGGAKVDATLFKQLIGSLMYITATRLDRGDTTELVAYIDSDYTGDIDDKRSMSGYVFLMNRGAVSWASKKQPVVTLSTIKAEFIVAASCAYQCVWMQRILQ